MTEKEKGALKYEDGGGVSSPSILLSKYISGLYPPSSPPRRF